MGKEIKEITGLGFDISIIPTDEHVRFPCDFHKLKEETSPLPCPEEPYLFLELNRMGEGISMCRKHYTQFMFDMMDAFDVFEDTDTYADSSDEKMVVKGDTAITRNGFYETFMRVKQETEGAST
jgi:hypothetical protein